MTIASSYYVRLTIAALLISFGTSKLLAQLFLASWEISSAGHSDIAARGVWLLAAFLPHMAGVSIVTGIGVLVALTRRTAMGWPARLVPGLIGSVIGGALVFFGADPTALALGLLPWQSSVAYHVLSAGVAAALIGLGAVVALRVMRAREIVAAAV